MKAAKSFRESIEEKANQKETITKRENDKSDGLPEFSLNMREEMDELKRKAKIKPDCGRLSPRM